MKELRFKIVKILEIIYLKISTQFKLLQLAEKKAKPSITRNNKSEITRI